VGTLTAIDPGVVALQEAWCDPAGWDRVIPSNHYAVVADLRY
jgi:hypothetical protein